MYIKLPFINICLRMDRFSIASLQLSVQTLLCLVWEEHTTPHHVEAL